MSESLSAALSIGDTVLYQELEEEVVLLNMESQQYYGLNDVGAEMWRCLLEAGTVGAAVERLSDRYEIDPQVLQSDLDRLVRELLGAGLLKAR